MKYRVRLTARAQRDLDDVLGWFVEHDAAGPATRWLEQLYTAIETLEQMPKRCGLAEEAVEVDQEVRELHVGKRQHKYRILFRIDGRTVHILHIRHAAREKLLPEDL